jgi:rubrerythrin
MMAYMAEEELKHLAWFEKMDLGALDASEHPDLDAMGRELLTEMLQDRSFSLEAESLHEVRGIHALLSRSLAFEHDTIVFYQALGAFIDDEETRLQIERIIEEERRHVGNIERMQASINSAP